MKSVAVKNTSATSRNDRDGEGLWDRRARKAGYSGWKEYWDKLEEQASMTAVYRLMTNRDIRPTANGGAIGICPFHDDQNPSMSILPGDKRFYCHSTNCNAQGSVFDFIRQIQGCTLAAATFWLAEVLDLPPVHLPGTGKSVYRTGSHRKANTNHKPAGTASGLHTQKERKAPTYGELLNPPPDKLPCNGDTLSAWHPVRKRWQSIQADHWHVYRDKSAKPLLLVGRRNAGFNTPKRFYRLTWRSLRKLRTARAGWVMTGWPTGELTPLFGTENLAIHTEDIRNRVRSTLSVLIVEGERTCEAGQEMLAPDWCVLTALGGGKAVQSAQWKDIVASWQSVVAYAIDPMRIVIWPDADWTTNGNNPALGFVTKICQCLEKAFGPDVGSRNLCRLEVVWPRETWPKGFDLADLRPDAGPWIRQQLTRTERQGWSFAGRKP